MIDYTFFLYISIAGAIFGAIMGYMIFSGSGGVLLTIITMLLCAAFIGGCAIHMTDTAYQHQTSVCENINLTVVDTFQQHTIIGEDLTAKLNTGYIVYYDDPYIWKSVKHGDMYPAISVKYKSFVKGNVSEYIYDKFMVPIECQIMES